VFLLYYCLNPKWQNKMLLLAGYFFFGYWNWKLLSLLIFSTFLDYFCGLGIYHAKNKSRKTLYLIFSITGNLGLLGFFKYYNFFAGNFEAMLTSLGFGPGHLMLNIILPIGISFYTFQTMSYTIDIYRGEMKPTKDFASFALFVSFFPQLVAGPIERATNLLPQVLKPRHPNRTDFYQGSWLIFWGLYKKMFVADNVARIVEKVYQAPGDFSGFHILIATYAFAVQIYCDFSGYSDIARGLAKTLGFQITMNFNIPYAAKNPQDFWRRWHISLSRWLRDYLYIPLGGSRRSRSRIFFNLMATMTLGGLWHGAQWHFVIWGIYHGLLLVGYRLVQGPRKNKSPSPWWKNALLVLLMFHFTCIGWMLFRIRNITDMGPIISNMVNGFHINSGSLMDAWILIQFSILVIIIQLFQYFKKDIMIIFQWSPWVRVILYLIMYFSLSIGGAYEGRAFIYFQF